MGLSFFDHAVSIHRVSLTSLYQQANTERRIPLLSWVHWVCYLKLSAEKPDMETGMKLGLQQLKASHTTNLSLQGCRLVPPDREGASIPVLGCRSLPRTLSELTSLVDYAVTVKLPYMLTPRTGWQNHLLLTTDLLLWEFHRRLGNEFHSGGSVWPLHATAAEEGYAKDLEKEN